MATKKISKELSFLEYFEKFILDSKSGKRLQPNGKKISSGTIANYKNVLRLIKQFSEKHGFAMRLKKTGSLNQREMISEKNYWNKFQKRFSEYLYKDCGYFDNYTGSVFKTIKTFFAYINKGLGLGVGEFYRNFYVCNEDNALLVLMPEELNFFIYNKQFENSISESLQRTKDMFVIGCTIALRFSDLILLQRSNIRISNDTWYLTTRSKKTGINTVMKLPEYAVDILSKYHKVNANNHRLLPRISNTNLNKNIKKLLEKAGFTHCINKTREKRGVRIELFKQRNGAKETYRMCDLVSTHTMRRTAITTMLSLGSPKPLSGKSVGIHPEVKTFINMFPYLSHIRNRKPIKCLRF